MSDILNSIVGIIGLVVSIVAVIISINTTKQQIKMELFKKRFDFYVACDTICGTCIIKQPQMIVERLKVFGLDFNHYTFSSAEFLFDKETSQLILSIYSNGMAYRDIRERLEHSNMDDNSENLHQQLKNTEEQLEKFFLEAREELHSRFKKYLVLEKR